MFVERRALRYLASHNHSRKKQRTIPILMVVLKPQYDLLRPDLSHFESPDIKISIVFYPTLFR